MDTKFSGLVKSRPFVLGLISGIFFSAIITILVISFNSPKPETKHIKGTMSDWTPTIGDVGVVEIIGSPRSCPCPGNQCEIPEYIIRFTGDNGYFCTGMFGYTVGQTVQITSVTNECINVFVSATSQ